MKRFSLIVLLALSVASCTGLKQKLGMERSAPDEFTVAEHAPLTVPPNFDLMPPKPGAAPRQETQTDTAKGLILGSESSAPKAASSPAEQALLSKAGAHDKARQDLQTAPPAAAGDVTVKDDDQALDPNQETAHLRQNNIATVPGPSASSPLDDNAQ